MAIQNTTNETDKQPTSQQGSLVEVSPIVSQGTVSGKRLNIKTLALAGSVVLLVLNTIGVGYLLFVKKQTPVTIEGQSGDVSKVLTVDIPSESVGIVSSKPQGLQVGATIKVEPRGTPNVRLGLLNNSPAVVFEGLNDLQWQFGLGNNGLQYGEVGQPAAFSASSENGQVTTTIGNKADSKVVLTGSNINAPNNLSINSDTIYLNTNSKQVGIGTADTRGKKLYVAGSIGASGTITAGDQFLAVNGTASKPSIAFQNDTTSGIFLNNNSVSVSAKGVETLKVTSGSAQVIGNLQANGYIRTGTAANNPSWQVKRITGTITGPDMYISHGVGASNRILIVEAYYLDSAGRAQPIFDYFDNSVVHLVNGIAGRPYTMTIIYASSGAGW
jgi:hypothetical protein